MLQIGLGDGVGDVGGELRIRGSVADQKQIGVGRARYLKRFRETGAFEARWASLRAFARLVVPACSRLYFWATGRRTASDWMSLTWVARN